MTRAMRRVPYLAVLVLLGCSKKDQDATAPPPPAVLVVPAPKEAASSAPAAIELPPPPLTGKTVLHVGDSMVGDHWGLTRALAAKVEAEGGKVVRNTVVSETIATFDRDATLRDLLRKHQPDVVVITLGTNDTTVPHPEVNAKHVASIARRIAPRECWWIGPPLVTGKADNGIAEVIEKNSAPCKFFDSRRLELQRGRDGIHPTDKGGAVWADAFWTAFRAPAKPTAVATDLRP
jgi:acyl-CoA thioesterase-1